MSLLLDTHFLLWAAGASHRLPEDLHARINDPETAPVFSVASLWGIAIKSALGCADFAVDGAALRAACLKVGYVELPVTGAHALAVGGLPHLHRDPFDRILLAQTRCEGLTLATADAQLAGYGAGVLRI